MQPPSSSARVRRSAATARWVTVSSRIASSARVRSSSRRHSIPRRPLPHGRQEPGRAQTFADPMIQSQAAQARPRPGSRRRAVPRSPGPAGSRRSPGAGRPSGRPEARGPGTDAGAIRSRPTRLPGSRSRLRWTGAIRASAEFLAGRDGCQDQRVGPLGRQILQAVDGDLDPPVEQSPLDLLGEQPRDRRSPPGACSGRGRPGS